jgi:quercetin dioxygenase-like cupin family protein
MKLKPRGGRGKEIVVFNGDLGPGAVATRHSHPGDEAIYMLEGALRFTPDHEQPFELKAGEITFNPAKHIHQAKNESSSAPAKVLNCMIAEKGPAARHCRAVERLHGAAASARGPVPLVADVRPRVQTEALPVAW